jgi:hypothetical protein
LLALKSVSLHIVKVEVKFTLQLATKQRGGVEAELYFYFNLSATCGWEVNATPRPLYPRERDPIPIV